MSDVGGKQTEKLETDDFDFRRNFGFLVRVT